MGVALRVVASTMPAIIAGAMDDTPAPLQWILPGGVRLAYSTRADGDQRDPAARERWTRALGITAPVAVPGQVHGSLVLRLPAAPAQLALADGLASGDRAAALGVFGADCPGLCVLAGGALAVAHCGWRGTAAAIVARLIAALEPLACAPRHQWLAFIGPGISAPRYEVDAAVLDARSWPAAALGHGRPGHAQLDLAAAIEHDLRALGVAAVTRCGVCTAGDPRLWSYRSRGAGPVQLLVAWRGPS
jgi:copper oxidase (laccase) domain-containing protein